MTFRLKLTHVLVGIVAGALLAGGGYALASTQSRVIHACVNAKTRALTVPTNDRCSKGYVALAWSRQGPKGSAGAKGAAGSQGAAGASGAPATVSVGSVTTEPAGSQASVTNSGTGGNAILNFGIPQGAAGQNGSDGTDTGPTAYGQVWMGSSSAELAPGANSQNITGVGSGGVGTAYVQIQGCSSPGLSEPVLNVTADKDASDTIAGANNTTNTAVAWVAHWSTVPDTSLLSVEVQTTNPTGGSAVDSDFSITVNC
jgi:hypothetical protein